MAKSRDFSIYLLKQGFNQENSLKEEHALQEIPSDEAIIPDNSFLFLADNRASIPWWVGYWNIQRDVYQSQKGAILFLQVQQRFFAITFGLTYHNLKDVSYEYDFGLRTTLNVLDPELIKSTDIFQPESARRQRIQSPTAANLNYFDIKYDETIFKRLAGAVKAEYRALFKNATGASSLKISSALESTQILNLCVQLLVIYEREDFKRSFPEIQNIQPVKDPAIISRLDDKLVEAFNGSPTELVLNIPEIVDYSTSFNIKYSGAGPYDLEFHDVFIRDYREYLTSKSITVSDSAVFLKHHLNITDENNQKRTVFSIYKCFIFDCELDGQSYHLADGNWFLIDKDYIQRLNGQLSRLFVQNHDVLQACTTESEADYNLIIAEAHTSAICLDRKNIAPSGQTAIEPCDVLVIRDNGLEFIHVKISTRSASLSHLFNQGVNSIEALRMFEESRTKLILLCAELNGEISRAVNGTFEVVFGIISSKPPEGRAKNLPLFSRISLLRATNDLKRMGISCKVVFVPNHRQDQQ